MYAFRRKILINSFKLFDLVTMAISLIFAVMAVHNHLTISLFSRIGQVEIKIVDLAFFVLALITWQIIYSYFKLYHSKRFSKQSKEGLDVLKATSVGAIIILFEAQIFQINDISVQVVQNNQAAQKKIMRSFSIHSFFHFIQKFQTHVLLMGLFSIFIPQPS